MMADLRYPIGAFKRPEHTTEAQRIDFIAAIAEAPPALDAAVAGFTAEQLDTPYRPGGWTVRQVVHHLPDSHMNSYVRFRLALTENEPTIKPYDEARWAELADAKTCADRAVAALIENLHQRWVLLLRSLSTADWSADVSPSGNGLDAARSESRALRLARAPSRRAYHVAARTRRLAVGAGELNWRALALLRLRHLRQGRTPTRLMACACSACAGSRLAGVRKYS